MYFYCLSFRRRRIVYKHTRIQQRLLVFKVKSLVLKEKQI